MADRRDTSGPSGRSEAARIAVIRLGRGSTLESREVGGKAEALDHLARAGLPVPPGWVVPTRTYREWLSRGCGDSLRRLGALVAAEVPLAGLVQAVRDDARASAVAETIQEALERAVPSRLIHERFATRSSAVGEDGVSHSFAGIYESFPGLRWEELGAGVVLCWASAFTPRAEEYRIDAGLEAADAPVAVVVQPLIRAQVAGVAFTADPTNGSRSSYLVNAAWGLGTTLVDGRVQPDQFRVSRDARKARDVRALVGDKRVQDAITPAGLETLPVPQADQQKQTLSGDRVLALARVVRDVERVTDSPQDIEWAWDGRKFWVLQARPITHLPEPPEAGVEWTRANYRELYPELPTPLTSSYIEQLESEWGIDYFSRRGLDAAHLGPFLKLYQGRPFINLSVLKYVTLALGGQVDSLSSYGTQEEAADAAEMDVRKVSMLQQASIGWRYWCGRKTALRVLRYIQDRLRVAEAIEPQTMSDFALVSRIEDAFLEMQPIDDAANDLGGALSLRRVLVESLIGKYVDSLDSFLNDVTVSGPENVSVAQALDLLRLGAAARLDEDVRQFFLGSEDELRSYWVALAGTEFLEQFRAFLKTYGHRSMHESDSSVARFREDPVPILRAIAATVRSPRVEMPEQREQRQQAAAAAAWERLKKSLPASEKVLPARYGLARQTVRTIQLLMRYREGFRSEMARMIGERRRLEVALGHRWHKLEYLERPEDIYWLRIDELRRATEERAFKSLLRSIVRDRKAEYERLARLSVSNLLVETSEGIRGVLEPVSVQTDDESGLLLKGQPVSSGITEGEVRVIETPEDAADIAPGTILVSPVVGPSWGPLYSIAGGLIVEMGGALSHGAILAREYGLPTVTNIPGVTRSLRTGDRVFLNANAGLVWRAPARPEENDELEPNADAAPRES